VGQLSPEQCHQLLTKAAERAMPAMAAVPTAAAAAAGPRRQLLTSPADGGSSASAAAAAAPLAPAQAGLTPGK
jgi:hypothetical protein